MKRKLPVCVVCHKPYDNSKDNYGWHINESTGIFEHCRFPLQWTASMMHYKIIKQMIIEPPLMIKEGRIIKSYTFPPTPK